MQLKYLTKCTVKNFNPFHAKAKAAMVLINRLNVADTRQRQFQLDLQYAPKTSDASPIIEITYKDGNKLVLDGDVSTFEKLSDQIEVHSKKLKFEELLNA